MECYLNTFLPISKQSDEIMVHQKFDSLNHEILTKHKAIKTAMCSSKVNLKSKTIPILHAKTSHGILSSYSNYSLTV